MMSEVDLPTSRRLIIGLAFAALLFAPIREVFAVELNVLAAGAVEAVVRDVVGRFEKESGHTVKLTYAPVGALRDKIYAGEPADLTIVTPVIIEQLLSRGLVSSASRTDLGRVGGGIAVRKGAPDREGDLPCRPEDRYCWRPLPPGGGPAGDRGGGA
jgi:molybdate transport system substrate-binding protein